MTTNKERARDFAINADTRSYSQNRDRIIDLQEKAEQRGMQECIDAIEENASMSCHPEDRVLESAAKNLRDLLADKIKGG